MNHALITAVLATVIAQLVKLPIYYYKHGVWDWRITLSTGSMPSSHTATVIALATSVGYLEGMNSSVYAVAMIFALITMHDAVKVRGQSGKQAQMINSILTEIDLISKSISFNLSMKEREKRLKELIGHSTSEVIMGMLCGIATSLTYMSVMGIPGV